MAPAEELLDDVSTRVGIEPDPFLLLASTASWCLHGTFDPEMFHSC